MRVISGKFKGRNLNGFNIKGTRPTMDRVKESLFAIIQDYIKDSVVLDLFSGSGNLGIEAISNGSKLCYFNDNNNEAIKIIKDNINKLEINDKCVITNSDYKDCLSNFIKNNISFDIVFLDPPYKDLVLNEVIDILLENNMINNNGLIVCEVSNNYLNEYKNIIKIKEKKYGDKFLIIYKVKIENINN